MILIALSQEDTSERVILEVSEDRPVRVGRLPQALEGEAVDLLQIPWRDRLVSRNHFVARREGDDLLVERLPALTGRSNPNAFYSNVASKEREELIEPHRLSAGDSFCIGIRGTTSFFWLNSEDEIESALKKINEVADAEVASFAPLSENLVSYDEVEQLDDYSLRLQLKLLQRELPEQVLSGWTDEDDLFSRASLFLENALPGQKGVSAGYVAVSKESDGIEFEMLNRDPTARADFRPSRTLLGQMNLDNPSPREVHVWTSRENQRVFHVGSLGSEIDWVAVLPVASMDEKATVFRDAEGRPVFQYVVVRQASETAAAAFVPFLRLISSLIASLLQAREEQRVQDRMATYFSPALREMMGRENSGEFEPDMVDCTVMFADRRGSSRLLEKAKTDEQILDRLEENQKIVGLITETIFAKDGVVTDFAGDGALALWGWPKWIKTKRAHARFSVETAEKIVRDLADRGGI